MKYNEIKRLQQLAGILTEVKVNNPTIHPLILKYKDIIDKCIQEWIDEYGSVNVKQDDEGGIKGWILNDIDSSEIYGGEFSEVMDNPIKEKEFSNSLDKYLEKFK